MEETDSIVFVVDDSGSMMEEQGNLATNFPMFANLLSSYVTTDGQHIDYRVGVTTTGRDLDYKISNGGITLPAPHQSGPNGAFMNDCGNAKRWMDSTDPDIATQLPCRADVGVDGNGNEMPMAMAKWALSLRIQDGTQAGFLRDDALLGVVMLTDEDDQSTEMNNFTITITQPFPMEYGPAEHVAFLDTLKGYRTRWASAVIAGDGDCTSQFGDAVNAQRLKDFVTQANNQGTTQAVFSSICAGDLTIALKQALDLFQAACGDIIL